MCVCVQPLYKEDVIAIIKKAREIQISLLMFILVSFSIKFHSTRKIVVQKSARCVARLLMDRMDGLFLVIREI